jgi:enoyl-CoA hydratase/carnithine racemase
VSAYRTLLVEKSPPACVITLNRPQRRNAISGELMDELIAALASVDGDGEVRGVVVTGGND